MAEIGATRPTLIDWAKRLDPNGMIANVAEVINKKSPLARNLRMQEGNLPTGHQYVHRTGLPTVYYRLINQGVPSSKSTTAQVTEQAAIMDARSTVDRDLALLNGNSAAWRLSESRAFLEAMAQKAETTIFYGNGGTDPEQFSGLATRYSSLTAGNGENIIDAGGTGSDNASIWFVNHDAGFYGIFPKGSRAGLVHEDLGLIDALDSSGNKFRAYEDWYQWKIGVALENWSNVVRIANIDISNLRAQSSAANLTRAMIEAFNSLDDASSTVIYMNRTVANWLEVEQYEAVKTGGGLTYETVDGRSVRLFRNMRIELTDALLNTEARVI